MSNNFIVYYNSKKIITRVHYNVDPSNQQFIIIRRRPDLIKFIKTIEKYKYNNSNIYFVLLDDIQNLSLLDTSNIINIKEGQQLFIGINYRIPFIIPTSDLSKRYNKHTLITYKMEFISDIYPYSVLIPEDGM